MLQMKFTDSPIYSQQATIIFFSRDCQHLSLRHWAKDTR